MWCLRIKYITNYVSYTHFPMLTVFPYNPPPDLCCAPFAGSLGTAGRVCNQTSRGMDSCEVMCCGRGYDTSRVSRMTKCECKFHWCCAVRCQDCLEVVDIHTCKAPKSAGWISRTWCMGCWGQQPLPFLVHAGNASEVFFTFMPVLPLLFIAQKLLNNWYKPCSIYFVFLHDNAAAELSVHKLMQLWKDVLMPTTT